MTSPRYATALLAALLATLLGSPLAVADGGGGGPDAGAADPEYTRAVSLIDAGRHADAIPLLKAYAARSPDDANAENWLGYAHRKTGNLDAAFVHYDRALKIDPKHRGAHEYIGEAYLMAGNLAKAEEHLKALDRLCLLPCEQYTDLKQSIAAYKANGNRFVAR